MKHEFLIRQTFVGLKAITASLIFSITASVAQESDTVEEKVMLYNWPDYIPKGVLTDFIKETGIHVVYSTFDNNEIMYAKLKLLKGRGYDVIVPSTYMVSRLRDEGLIRSIDSAQIDNFKHLNPTLLNKPFDPDNEYSIPYLWGSTGIAVDTEKVDIKTVTSWKDLWHKRWRGKLLLLDDMREAFHIAFKVGGHSTNTTNLDEINQAYQRLRRLMPSVKILSGDPQADLLDDEIELAVTWNGEVILAQEKRPAIHYIYPNEGTSFWIDSFVIPARAVNLENAYAFIDYMLRPEVAARCVQELGYATANLAALELLDESIRENPVIFPPRTILSKAEFQEDIGKAMDVMSLYWEILKTIK